MTPDTLSPTRISARIIDIPQITYSKAHAFQTIEIQPIHRVSCRPAGSLVRIYQASTMLQPLQGRQVAAMKDRLGR
jgi:hypothetical protein